MGVPEMVTVVQETAKQRARDGVREIPRQSRPLWHQRPVVHLQSVALDNGDVSGNLTLELIDEVVVDFDGRDRMTASGQKGGDGERARAHFQKRVTGLRIDEIHEHSCGFVTKEVLAERTGHRTFEVTVRLWIDAKKRPCSERNVHSSFILRGMRRHGVVSRKGLVLGLAGLAVASIGFSKVLWSWVLDFDPGFAFGEEAVSTGSPLTSRVTILLVDGLRVDASRRMPTLNSLRGRGADIEAQVGTPSFSRPGRATLGVGSPPAIHGVTTNRQRRAITLDNLIRRVGERGGTCRVAGSAIWPSLFSRDIAQCGLYRAGEAKEGPGAFVRQVPSVRAAQARGIEFILEEPSTLRIADIISTDFAAHEYGGASSEYQAEVLRADATLAELVGRLDLAIETLVVTSDHGHRDAGGHGGEEPEVLAIPVVMVGAGIRPASRDTAFQADIAPTVAALLGTALPSASSGRPILSVLLADEEKLALVKAASSTQKSRFDKAVGDRLGIVADQAGDSDWPALVRAKRTAEERQRGPAALLLAVLVLAGAVTAFRFAQPAAPGLIAGVLALGLALIGSLGARLPPLSFSAINYDEMLIPFFERVMGLAALATIGMIGAALLVGRLARRPGHGNSAISLAGSVGLLVSATLAVALIAWWWRYDLLSASTLPGPDALVQAYSLALSIVSVSLASLAMMGVLRLLGGREL